MNPKKHSGGPKKIILEILNDSEIDFFLALYRLKANKSYNPSDVKILIDAIAFNENWMEEKEQEIITNLNISWKYIHSSAKSSADYRKVSHENFDDFMKAEFGQAIKGLHYYFHNLKGIAENGETAEFKTEISLLQVILNGFTQFGQGDTNKLTRYNLRAGSETETLVIESTQAGFKVTDKKSESVAELEPYYEQSGKLKKITSLNETEKIVAENQGIYFKTGANFIKVIQDEKSIHYTFFHDVPILDDDFDLSSCKKENLSLSNAQLKIEAIESCGEIDVKAPIPEIENIQVNITATTDISANVKSIESFGALHRIPEGVKSQSFLRHRIVTMTFEQVTKAFPELSNHVRNIVTGYLCIPFGVLDTEEEHNESKRSQTYHEYVGKTIKNTLNSKPIS